MSNLIENYKGEKRVKKILEFLNNGEMKPILYLFSGENNEKFEPFRQIFMEIIHELSYGDKKKLDYKLFPWREEIKKKIIEKYGTIPI